MTSEHRDHLVAIVDHIAFGESVRWRHDRVWYCDWIDGTVVSVTPDGLDRTVHHNLDGFPFCIDWDLEGRLLIVDGARQRVLRQHGEGLDVLADLSPVSDAPWNEIATHPSGRVFVNGIGYDLMAGDAATTGQIAVIDTDGTIRQVADDLASPMAWPSSRVALAWSWPNPTRHASPPSPLRRTATSTTEPPWSKLPGAHPTGCASRSTAPSGTPMSPTVIAAASPSVAPSSRPSMLTAGASRVQCPPTGHCSLRPTSGMTRRSIRAAGCSTSNEWLSADAYSPRWSTTPRGGRRDRPSCAHWSADDARLVHQ